jgi:hypothetical protein
MARGNRRAPRRRARARPASPGGSTRPGDRGRAADHRRRGPARAARSPAARRARAGRPSRRSAGRAPGGSRSPGGAARRAAPARRPPSAPARGPRSSARDRNPARSRPCLLQGHGASRRASRSCSVGRLGGASGRGAARPRCAPTIHDWRASAALSSGALLRRCPARSRGHENNTGAALETVRRFQPPARCPR